MLHWRPRERKRERNREVRQELSPFQTICPNQWHPFTKIGENELYFIQKSYTYRPSFVRAHSRASKLFLSSDGIVDMHQNVKKWFVREARQTFIRAREHYLLISKPAVWQGAPSFNPPWPLWTVSVTSKSQAFFVFVFLLSVSRFFAFPVSRPLLVFLATSNETHLSITPVTTSPHSAPWDFDHSVLLCSLRAPSSRLVDWPAALINHKVSLSRWRYRLNCAETDKTHRGGDGHLS